MKIIKLSNNKPNTMNNKQYNAIKSIRKPMPPPSHAHQDNNELYDKRSTIPSNPDLPTFSELIHDANTIAELKGHKLSQWKHLSPTSMTNHCSLCNKSITINTNPLESELDIDGPASIEICN